MPQPDARAASRSAKVPILMYHYISTLPADADKYRLDLSVAPEDFESQLKYLADNGYHTVSLYDVYNDLSTGAALPAQPVVLTFDDGYRDAYDFAFPLLTKYGFTGTFFIVSEFIDKADSDYLTWPMIQEMSAAGMSIESHSRSHIDLRGRSFQDLVWQLLGPIESITAYTGKRPHFFCYPSGRYDDAVMRVLKSVETWAAVTTQYGANETLSNAMTWPRIRVHGGATAKDFAALLR
jgi:peptidoglycan/xylan/chitin deacetylase (PgdA/CDA1 family)